MDFGGKRTRDQYRRLQVIAQRDATEDDQTTRRSALDRRSAFGVAGEL
jgi:hypothetical protein